MSNQPIVSAVVTTYNDAEYVADAVESVLDQTRPVDELFVVDGGSTDGTRDIVSQYDQVELLVEPDTTISQTRNAGIRRSNGELIAFLDADDMWVEDKVARQAERFDGKPELGLVYSDFNRVSPDNTFKSIRRARSIPQDRFLETLFVRGGAVLPSTVMVRRECFADVGTFDDRLAMAEERDMWLRIGAEWQTERIPEPLLRRRERERSLGFDIEERFEYEQLITEKMVSEYPSLEALRDKREAHLLYRRATFRLLHGRSGARRDLLTAIRKDPTMTKAYLRLGISFLPAVAVRGLSKGARELKYRLQ